MKTFEDGKNYFWIAINKIADDLNLSRRQVQNALYRLENKDKSVQSSLQPFIFPKQVKKENKILNEEEINKSIAKNDKGSLFTSTFASALSYTSYGRAATLLARPVSGLTQEKGFTTAIIFLRSIYSMHLIEQQDSLTQ